ncbi:monosaccharide ABC transporter substrate-binding protein (CUT2 family) [Isoptericola sp. CG 20/1183]|uniref:Monosaccharide ABC transporter substrate-binding protein (CUT2 family) n=1 Tax=Isoptericola halotolerans TaxID=300560 RepID=A0ABX5EHD7_9MICO|nr:MULTISPECIES: multiple monosaccharide ABC transporter substrate-binding protein [Isoptericola]PRZ06936.1 monosaccharide ABC transporter substrate-binding protein (CUT2 family) [Isoptericola halotolerans]PRZ07392.1 monosaccharide ABC transporter substrate-binding protein (CUT2 family) [Isoptericola sp. CG 20/1183]
MRLGKKMGVVAAGAALALTLTACAGEGAGSDSGSEDNTEAAADGDLSVGVAMPTETSERWIADGDAVKSGLEEAGYSVDLQFAGDDIPTQTQQIDAMITGGADALIIAAIDGTALTSQLEAAAAADIPVISYDRLIRDSENVDFYVSFDNYKVGVAQATALLSGLGLTDEAGEPTGEEGPFNVELFAGSLDDNNAHFFWDGAMDTLKPFMDDGSLVVPSGQTDIDQAATLRWQQETAQKRMEDLLTSTYNDGTELHGVLSPYDGLSRGIITALQGVGMGPTMEEGLPVVTGQDAEIASVKLIQDDVQQSTIFKDTRKLADQAVVATEAYLAGEEPEANDTETYDNGVKVVPSYLLEVDTVYADNITELLVDSGYWTQEEIDAGQAE